MAYKEGIPGSLQDKPNFQFFEELKKKVAFPPLETTRFDPTLGQFTVKIPDPKQFLGEFLNTPKEVGYAASVIKNLLYGGTSILSLFLSKAVYDGKKRLSLPEVEKMLNGRNLPFNGNPLDFSPILFTSSIGPDENRIDYLKSLGIDIFKYDEIRLAIFENNKKVEAFLSDVKLHDQVDENIYLKYMEAFDRIVTIANDETYADLVWADEQLDYILKVYKDFFYILKIVSANDEQVVQWEGIITELEDLKEVYSIYLKIWYEKLVLLKGEFVRFEDRQLVDIGRASVILDKGFRVTLQADFSRSVFSSQGYPSISPLATFLPFSGKDEKAVTEEPFGNIKTDIPVAAPVDGTGDLQSKAATSDVTEWKAENVSGDNIPDGVGVGPLVGPLWQKYIVTLGKRESGNNYGAVNRYGYVGRWQFGAGALIDTGYVRHGTKTRQLKYSGVWTGKDGVYNRVDWLKNVNNCQDKAMIVFTRKNYQTLLRMGVITKYSPPAVVGGFLAVAHLLGCGGARNLKNGLDGADGNGTKGSSYYNMMYAALSGQEPPPPNTATTKLSPEALRAAVVDSHHIPDAATISMPQIGGAPQYPHNKVKVYESGHIKEYDNTPGFERIAERHRTGTGYEINANGDFVRHVVGSSYKAVLGSDYMIVQGAVQIIAVGDVGIKAMGDCIIDSANDLHLNVAGDMHVAVKGDYYQKVEGNYYVDVEGDESRNVGGFQKIAVEQDYELKAAAVTVAADDTDVNIGAARNINAAAGRDYILVSGGNVTTAAGGNNSQFANGEIANVAKGDATFQAGGKASVMGKSQTTIHSDADLSLDAASITNQVPVTKASWSERAVIAETSGPAPEPQVSPDGGKDKEGDRAEGEEKRDETRIRNAIEELTTIDTSKTQRGRESEAYSKGIEIA